MRNLFLVLFVFFLFSCKESPQAQVKFEKIKYEANNNSYNIYFTSNINLDSLAKKEKRELSIFCSLEDSIDFTINNRDKIQYFAEGGVLSKDSLLRKDKNNYQTAWVYFKNNKRGVVLAEIILNKGEIKELLSGKECISCKIYDGGYFFKAPYYFEPFCIPVKDIIKVLDDSIK